MIEHYSDHAANERTFLAWVRTAIAVMAFGFLVEKFDLFLAMAAQSMGGRAMLGRSQWVGNIAGLLLILLGGAMMALAALRFRSTTLDIASADIRPGGAAAMDFVLVGLLLLLGATLFCYLMYTVIDRMSGPV
jgi:putative membrane protein